MSLPAVILADGPGSLAEREREEEEERRDRGHEQVYMGCLIYWERWDPDRRVNLRQDHGGHAVTRNSHLFTFTFASKQTEALRTFSSHAGTFSRS